MDALRTLSPLDPMFARQLMELMQQAQTRAAAPAAAPDRYDGATGNQSVPSAPSGFDPQLLIDYALQASGQSQTPGRNLGTMTPSGGASPSGSASPTGNAAVDAAKKLIGTPYNFSHARPPTDGSLDCSQLVSQIYPNLPPDVVTQGNMGTPKDPSQAQAGDLVFFDENGSGQATHVGIADGQGNVIHASDYAGQVTVTPIADIASTRTWATSPS